jgi:hypothetical protein
MKSGQRNQDENSAGGTGGNVSSVLTLSSGVSELSQLALWMAANLAGMVSAVLTARTPFFRSVMQRLGIVSATSTAFNAPANSKSGKRRRRAPEFPRPSREESLPMLAEAIVGSSKSSVASVFGPPRSAVVMQAMPGATYWQADTWYYPLPKSGPLAMAIRFEGDDARHVEFLRAPEV